MPNADEFRRGDKRDSCKQNISQMNGMDSNSKYGDYC